jgi:hypothetical protein
LERRDGTDTSRASVLWKNDFCERDCGMKMLKCCGFVFVFDVISMWLMSFQCGSCL